MNILGKSKQIKLLEKKCETLEFDLLMANKSIEKSTEYINTTSPLLADYIRKDCSLQLLKVDYYTYRFLKDQWRINQHLIAYEFPFEEGLKDISPSLCERIVTIKQTLTKQQRNYLVITIAHHLGARIQNL